MRALELKVPPPVVALVIAGAMWTFARAVPELGFPLPYRTALALALAAAGAATALSGVALFRRARTTVNPLKPDATSALVTSGIYRLTRNPMYLGLLFVLAGWAAYLAHLGACLVLPAFVLYLNRFQITPEERVLAARFGAEYSAYCAGVRRWL